MTKQSASEIILELARPSDAEALADISRRAFHSDIVCGAPSTEGGPPGYDSPKWQGDMMQRAAYFKVEFDGELAGGAIVFDLGKGQCYVARIFLDPALHGKGLGLALMQHLFRKYPKARKWTLETPPWNTRTRAFYLKLGFREIRETDEDVFFEKLVPEGTGTTGVAAV